MTATFLDQQLSTSALNGASIDSPSDVDRLLGTFHNRAPFFFRLARLDGADLTVGYSATRCCVQFTSEGGTPPYLVAIDETAEHSDAVTSFLSGSTPTEVPFSYCIPTSVARQVIADFVMTGLPSAVVRWREI